LRIDNSGDITRYALTLYYYQKSLLDGSRDAIVMGIYEMAYPIWYVILYISSKLNQDIQFVNFLASFTIYGSFLYIIYELNKKYGSTRTEKIIFIKFFLFMSIIGIFTSYKTLWAFSLESVGLFLLMREKKKGLIFILLAVGLHPVAWAPAIAYFVSMFIRFRVVYLYISFVFGLIFKSFASIVVSLLNIPFIGNKINSYMLGEWAQYRFHENGEYVKVAIMVLLIIFLFLIRIFKYTDFSSTERYFNKYNNFIYIYFSMALLFLSFRTIETRLMIEGMIFFVPLFYQVFLSSSIYKKLLL
jgi:hypothetical protein